MSNLNGSRVAAHFFIAGDDFDSSDVTRRQTSRPVAAREALDKSRALAEDRATELEPCGVNVHEVLLLDTPDGSERCVSIGTERYNWVRWEHRFMYDSLPATA